MTTVREVDLIIFLNLTSKKMAAIYPVILPLEEQDVRLQLVPDFEHAFFQGSDPSISF